MKQTVGSLIRRLRSGGRGGGVLLYGPPGAGKTLVARAVVEKCECAFIGVKGVELFDIYVGNSERRVRAVFERARDAAPCVAFLDEVDTLTGAQSR